MLTAKEIYSQTVRDLPSSERLRLATLILEDLAEPAAPALDYKSEALLEARDRALEGIRVSFECHVTAAGRRILPKSFVESVGSGVQITYDRRTRDSWRIVRAWPEESRPVEEIECDGTKAWRSGNAGAVFDLEQCGTSAEAYLEARPLLALHFEAERFLAPISPSELHAARKIDWITVSEFLTPGPDGRFVFHLILNPSNAPKYRGRLRDRLVRVVRGLPSSRSVGGPKVVATFDPELGYAPVSYSMWFDDVRARRRHRRIWLDHIEVRPGLFLGRKCVDVNPRNSEEAYMITEVIPERSSFAEPGRVA